MFKGTLKDIITNIFAFIMGVFSLIQAISIVWNQWIATVGQEPTIIEWIQLIISVSIAVVAWFTGKDGRGKAKVINKIG